MSSATGNFGLDLKNPAADIVSIQGASITSLIGDYSP